MPKRTPLNGASAALVRKTPSAGSRVPPVSTTTVPRIGGNAPVVASRDASASSAWYSNIRHGTCRVHRHAHSTKCSVVTPSTSAESTRSRRRSRAANCVSSHRTSRTTAPGRVSARTSSSGKSRVTPRRISSTTAIDDTAPRGVPLRMRGVS